MPTVSGDSPPGPEEFCADEVKVFKHEGEDEDDQNASSSLGAELLEEKSSLITESETGKATDPTRPDLTNPFMAGFNPFGIGYLNPYAAALSASTFLPDPLGTSPPPAHMGSLGATLAGRNRLYPPYPYPHLGMEQLAAAWHYQTQGRGMPPYALGFPPTSLASRLPHGGLFHQPGFGFPPGSPHLPHMKQEFDRPPGLMPHHNEEKDSPKKSKEPHIKKPLNAFMLYMKEMRPVVQAECTLKESAAINQILGRRWHGLTREEQAKYYEKARQERQKHMQMYPHWNARDNYRFGQKKKKRKRDKSDDPAASMKKCRARYGLDQQNLWCKPCRRKKKCIRVQMYLAGRTESEIEATRFDEEGECIPPLQRARNNQQHNGESGHNNPSVPSTTGSFTSSSNVSDGGSPASQGDSSNAGSLWSPATPGGLSVHSLGSPASIASPSTPQSFEESSYRPSGSSYKPPHLRPPVGTDPRDSKNPLSISSLTSSGSHSRENGHHSVVSSASSHTMLNPFQYQQHAVAVNERKPLL